MTTRNHLFHELLRRNGFEHLGEPRMVWQKNLSPEYALFATDISMMLSVIILDGAKNASDAISRPGVWMFKEHYNFDDDLLAFQCKIAELTEKYGAPT